MNKNLKKVLLATLSLLLTFCMAMSASAATYTTTTRYLTTSQIQVTSTATDVSEGEYVTYYVEDASGGIVYLDQETVGPEDEEVTFTYKTSTSNISAEMKFGGESETASSKGDLDFVEEGYVVAITLNGSPIKSVVVPEQELGLVLSRKFDVSGVSLGKVTGVTFNGNNIPAFAVTSDSIVIYTDAVTSDGTLNIISEEFDAMKVKYGTLTYSEGTLSVLAKVTALNSYEYGIILSDKNNMTASDVASAIAPSELSGNLTSGTVVKFRAIGKGSNGKYGLELNGVGNYLASGTYYVAAYVTDGVSVLTDASTMLGTAQFVID